MRVDGSADLGAAETATNPVLQPRPYRGPRIESSAANALDLAFSPTLQHVNVFAVTLLSSRRSPFKIPPKELPPVRVASIAQHRDARHPLAIHANSICTIAIALPPGAHAPLRRRVSSIQTHCPPQPARRRERHFSSHSARSAIIGMECDATETRSLGLIARTPRGPRRTRSREFFGSSRRAQPANSQLFPLRTLDRPAMLNSTNGSSVSFARHLVTRKLDRDIFRALTRGKEELSLIK